VRVTPSFKRGRPTADAPKHNAIGAPHLRVRRELPAAKARLAPAAGSSLGHTPKPNSTTAPNGGVISFSAKMPWYTIINWIRWALVCLFIYAALFLDEGEEGRYENRIERWWVRVNDQRRSALSAAATLIGSVAELAGRQFDRLFGRKLFSPRSLGVSVCFSIASLFLYLELANILLGQRIKQHPSFTQVAQGWGIFAVYLLSGIFPALNEGDRHERLWMRIWGLVLLVSVAIPTVQVLRFVKLLWGYGSVLRITAFLIFLLGFSFVCDVFYIALTRWMLRIASAATRLPRIIGIILLNLLLGAFLVLGPAYLGLKAAVYTARFNGPSFFGVAGVMFVVLGGAVNSVDLIACSVFLAFMIFILLHRLVWPVIERPLYAFARFGIIRRKRLLWAAALALIFARKGPALAELLRQILSKL
jgi:hypothetical protein